MRRFGRPEKGRGVKPRVWLIGLYGLTVALFGAALVATGVGPIAFLGLAGFAGHLGWQVWRVDIDDPDLCLSLFRSNRDAGWILFAGLVADGLRHLF